MSPPTEPVLLDRYEKVRDGKVFKIRIQRLTPDLYEKALDVMVKYFIPREPMCKNTGLLEEATSIQSFRNLWMSKVQQGAAIVALLDDDEPGKEPVVVGANMTGITYNEPSTMDVSKEGPIFAKVIKEIIKFMDDGDLFNKYGVDKYLTALGLVVHGDYHGLDIGYRILRAREPLCKLHGIKMTATVFTASASQYLAAKAGFEDVLVREFKEFIVDGKPLFSLDGKMILMAKKY